MSFNVVISNELQVYVAKALLSLGRSGSNTKREDMIRKLCYIKPVKLSLKGKAKWDSDLRPIYSSKDRLIDEGDVQCTSCHVIHEHLTPCQQCMAKRPLHVVCCPACKKDSAVHNYKFQHADLDLKIKCIECKKLTHLRDWNCDCGKPWHVCGTHALGKASYNSSTPALARKSPVKHPLRGLCSKMLRLSVYWMMT